MAKKAKGDGQPAENPAERSKQDEPAAEPTALPDIDGKMLCVGGELDRQIVYLPDEWEGKDYGPQTVRIEGESHVVLLHKDTTPNQAVKVAAEFWGEL